MAKINGLDENEVEELETLEGEEKEGICDKCVNYEVCYSDGGELPNYINCFLDEDEDIFFESDDTKDVHVWKEMSYNKYNEH